MTYQQKYEELHNAFIKASDKYIKAEKEFSSILGWDDSTKLSDFLSAKREFEQAESEYHTFLSHVKKQNILPEQKFRPELINETL